MLLLILPFIGVLIIRFKPTKNYPTREAKRQLPKLQPYFPEFTESECRCMEGMSEETFEELISLIPQETLCLDEMKTEWHR